MTNRALALATPLLFAAACTSSAPPESATAHLATQLGAVPASDLVGTWVAPKATLELDAGGAFALTDDSAQPATTSAGAWGTQGHQLVLVYDANAAGSYRVTSTTFVAAGDQLGMGFTGAAGNSGAVGTWSASLDDQQFGANGTATSGTTSQVQLALAANGTATWQEDQTEIGPGGGTSTSELLGNYTVGSAGKLSVVVAGGSGTQTENLVPIGGSYADEVYARQ